MVSLDKLPSGKSAKVISVEGGFGCVNRLNNLGIREGITIKKITGTLSRGPVVLNIGNSQIALGRGMASKIMVKVL